MSILERTSLAGLAPKYLVIPVGIKWRVNIDRINASLGKLSQLIEVVPAIDHRSIHEGVRLPREIRVSALFWHEFG
jgi:hypothetical protein